MSLILVVEPDSRHAERIREALSAEGWTVRLASSASEADDAVPAPQLVVIDADVEGAAHLFERYSRRRGGPGTVALLSGSTDRARVPEFEAEALLDKPVADADLRLTISRCFAAKAPRPDVGGERFSSLDIFGDVLAEVESEPSVDRRAPVVAAPAPPVAPPAPAAPPASAPQPRTVSSQSSRGDVERQLEQTLSGMFGDRKPSKPTPPPAPRAPIRESTGVDDLLSQTLSGLGVGPTRKPAVKPAEAAVPIVAPVASPTPAAPPPTAPPPTAPPVAAAPVAATPAVSAPAVSAPAVSAPALSAPVVSAPAVAPVDRQPVAPAPVPAAPVSAPAPAATSTPRVSAAPVQPAAPPQAPASVTPSSAPPEPAAFATQKLETIKPKERKPPETGPRQFGQYTLLEKIATGGMAEVWKARMQGMEGFQKNVAIKRILPHLTDSSDFLTMFIDEAKLAAQLNHNNIIHIYDLGKIEEDYYIAMEFVDGRDLRSILNASRRRQQAALPLGIALLVTARLASALDYAHRKKDFDGRELGLVHRDVSPQNVLISFDGDIKLCDFGIVKAVAKASKTQMGALKGKLQYMSPEQAWGRVVDARSDIFSLGAVMFEMLTGRRLFAGESEISVLEAVRDCRIETPRSLVPSIPERVEKIVMRALAGEQDDRYQTAGEMQKELEKVLYGLEPTPSEGDLVQFMRGLFDDAPPVAVAAPTAPTPAVIAPAKATAPALKPVEMPTSAGVQAHAFEATGVDPAHKASKSRVLLIGGIAAALIAAVALLLFGRGDSTSTPPPAEPPAATTPADPPAAPPSTAPTPDLQAIVGEQVAEQEARLRETLDAEQRAIEEQVRRAEEAAAKAQTTKAPEPTKAPEATKAPEPTKAAPAVQPTPEPLKATPVEATPEPVKAPVVPETKAPPVETKAPPVETKAPAAAPPAPAKPTTKTGDLVTLAEPGVTPPKLIDMRKPEYPPMAKRLKVQGTVIVTVLVDESGAVTQSRVVRGVEQNVGINEAALEATKSARFEPATKDGVRVKVWYTFSMPFRL